MIPTIVLRMSTATGDIINVTGVGLLLLYVYFHSQEKRAKKSSVSREWRQKSTATLVGFAFYAVLVSTWGPSGTWVATVGGAIDSNIQQFARELVIVGEQTEQGSIGDQLVGTVKTIGLLAYIISFAAVSVSSSLIKKIASAVKSIP